MSGSGAGHGGYGGQSAALDGVGLANDSLWQPVSLGSGGGSGLGGAGGAGGGSVNLVIGGSLRVDGIVSANGANGMNDRSGGGSGGSIWVTCQNLSGAGVISVNGGAGEPSQGGGGGAGRISLNYAASTFSGLTPARGGSGYIRGGAGTIFTWADGQFAGQVLVDNGGNSGMSTPVSEAQALGLTAQGGAIISLPYSQTFGNLLVASNAWICLSNQTVSHHRLEQCHDSGWRRHYRRQRGIRGSWGPEPAGLTHRPTLEAEGAMAVTGRRAAAQWPIAASLTVRSVRRWTSAAVAAAIFLMHRGALAAGPSV